MLRLNFLTYVLELHGWSKLHGLPKLHGLSTMVFFNGKVARQRLTHPTLMKNSIHFFPYGHKTLNYFQNGMKL